MKHSYFFVYFFAILSFFSPAFVSAHQPYLVDGEKEIVVVAPEISKAYYGEFSGTSTVFMIREEKPFDLYLNILVPAIANTPTDVTAEIRKGGERMAFLEASSTDWARMYEPYGGDDYFQGPEWRLENATGTFEIVLSRPGNTGKYVLAVGEKESFLLDEMLRTMGILPSLKSDFFGKPAWTAFFNRIGLYLAIIFVGCIIVFFILCEIFRAIGKLFQKPKSVRD